MATRRSRRTLMFACLGLIASPLRADTGRSGALLLQQPLGSRPFALGQAYVALGDDAFGMSYNPAELTRLKESQFATQYMQGIAGTNVGYALVATPLSPDQALGLGVAYMDLGKGDFFDANGQLAGSRTIERDFLLQMGYSRAIDAPNGRAHFGGNAKVFRSVLVDEVKSTAFGADIGSLYEMPWRRGVASAGLVFANVGPPVKYSGGLATGASDPLPLTARLGFGYSHPVLNFDRLAYGLEFDRVFPEDALYKSVGVEYSYHGCCALRFGYRFGMDNGGLTFGAGLNVKNLSVDYGLGLGQTFNNVQHVSLTYRFTVPGIRYNNATPPTPLETMAARASSALAAKRYFDASAEIEHMQTFFPDSTEIIRVKGQIQEGLSALLLSGPGSSRYNYALGFRNYSEGLWAEAVSNLEASLKAAPDDEEAAKYLEKSKKRLEEQRRLLRLQQQARIGTLFELANQAYEDKETDRALRILNEISRMGPYQPAESLKRRIIDDERRPMEPVAKAHAPKQPTDADAAKAEQLFYEALRDYGIGNFDSALRTLYAAIRLNPSSESIRGAVTRIEREIKMKKESPTGIR